MTDHESTPVVVGIDGSIAAIETAQWAVGEARARDVPLRLISCANVPHTLGDSTPDGPEVEYARTSLREASAAVAATDESVKVEAEISFGPPSNALIAESRHAAMVCVGSVGIGAVARAVLGSTAVDVAQGAHCPVAIIRPATRGRDVGNWVAVGSENQPADDDTVLRTAFDEARVRHAPLVVVDLSCNTLGTTTGQPVGIRVDGWRQHYPDVDVDVIEARGALAEFLADNRDELDRRYPRTVALGPVVSPSAVLGSADVAEAARIVGPHDHALREHAMCSVLVAR
ncbi:universal stress protein [Mycolicibacterium arenosum]|uniref:Universal stress protein n=1 Tax=Mycolicibacterium arenosum TaxID=2952157 RepID=A0ABT1LVP9_9MYCO|nr:universal stress protein [Mycolicibacterium sp. CAU 1645]MCP9270984.1 universal stress protein [Mycolicibacterium sp. CAU 1645]